MIEENTKPIAGVAAENRFLNIDDLIDYLSKLAFSPMTEPGLVELDHALQCAAELKAIRPDDLELQVAGLVHDIAHSLSHIREHDKVGADAVRHILGDRVADLVALHVAAKRYLVATDDEYRSRLSPISVQTLDLQGGTMSADEIVLFEADPNGRDACLLRIADEAAKEPDRAVPGLDAWIEPLRRVAASRG
ncbi:MULTISPECIES: HD domain-containing protein [unclassified Sphingomonas]|uniref:HD domain-containing protein n=1 Tax=unclassified Sphingomonas TaxID=196159 RepID=UPI000BC8F202|nr:MAG: hypothetical protein B7Y98_10505 [Sphingomonas sp. 32-62-10]